MTELHIPEQSQERLDELDAFVKSTFKHGIDSERPALIASGYQFGSEQIIDSVQNPSLLDEINAAIEKSKTSGVDLLTINSTAFIYGLLGAVSDRRAKEQPNV